MIAEVFYRFKEKYNEKSSECCHSEFFTKSMRIRQAAIVCSVGQFLSFDDPLLKPLQPRISNGICALGHEHLAEVSILRHLNQSLRSTDLDMITSPTPPSQANIHGRHLSRSPYSKIYQTSVRSSRFRYCPNDTPPAASVTSRRKHRFDSRRRRLLAVARLRRRVRSTDLDRGVRPSGRRSDGPVGDGVDIDDLDPDHRRRGAADSAPQRLKMADHHPRAH